MKNIKGIITSTEQELIKKLYKEKYVQDFIEELKIFNLKYIAAMKETETKINILNEDYKIRYNHSPIENIETRLKTPESFIKKMLRNDIRFNINEVSNNIFDIAGVRIICSFISDIFDMVNIIKQNDEFTIVREKDYINNPKPSGYRSYHLIIKVPIYLTTGKEEVNVEIQIRTMAMDFWASLEHKIKYKYDGYIPEEVKTELIECANKISESDTQMMMLNNKIKNINKLINK